METRMLLFSFFANKYRVSGYLEKFNLSVTLASLRIDNLSYQLITIAPSLSIIFQLFSA
jgi:hypothetical protein